MLSNRKRWSMAVLMIAAAASLWATRWLADARRPPVPLPQARSDYVLEDFDLLVMNDQGMPSFRIVGPYLEKSPVDQSVSVDRPHMWLFEAGALSWEVRSESGWIRSDGEEILLSGEVQMEEQSGADISVQTRDLTIYPQDRLAQSQAPVDLRQPGMRMDGVGLDADLGTRRFAILAQVRGQYDPN